MRNEIKISSGLSPAALQQTVWCIRAGAADAETARRVMQHFCELWESERPIPRALLQHLYDAFHAYLYDGKTLESALGLVRRRGRPHAEGIRMRMATEILRLRMSGVSHQEALAQVSEQLACGISILGEAWASYKHYAVVLLRKERPLDRYPWTDQEARRLREIFDRKRTAQVRKNRLIKPA